jgi:hypothetical protein
MQSRKVNKPRELYRVDEIEIFAKLSVSGVPVIHGPQLAKLTREDRPTKQCNCEPSAISCTRKVSSGYLEHLFLLCTPINIERESQIETSLSARKRGAEPQTINILAVKYDATTPEA